MPSSTRRRRSSSNLPIIVGVIVLLRPLLDKSFRDQMLARLPAIERKALHAKFAAVTGDGEPWSWLHPFDDLDGKEMKTAIDAAERVKREGLRAISRDERLLILRAGGVSFLEQMLAANR